MSGINTQTQFQMAGKSKREASIFKQREVVKDTIIVSCAGTIKANNTLFDRNNKLAEEYRSQMFPSSSKLFIARGMIIKPNLRFATGSKERDQLRYLNHFLESSRLKIVREGVEIFNDYISAYASSRVVQQNAYETAPDAGDTDNTDAGVLVELSKSWQDIIPSNERFVKLPSDLEINPNSEYTYTLTVSDDLPAMEAYAANTGQPFVPNASQSNDTAFTIGVEFLMDVVREN